jgi:hypothetical protein
MQKPQVSASVSRELYDDIAEMAEKQDRSVSSMVAILLQQAVKEKKRKSKHGLQGSKV